ncbi:hypothetical protein [Paraburkholderia fynbosensis]|uniref:Peptidase S54 rhomboid domain-containing protein n=1 Tax=Paraburkholderia fynbosensis TaxID=1200993 RepID=A0A6J5GB00_9BURK|nr:hypothetical protein [Paraburkholderia fynbosensis]CAB3795451.1 hypothetical protein LMG27177_03849 [Paraburkholderia fynbosensis]
MISLIHILRRSTVSGTAPARMSKHLELLRGRRGRDAWRTPLRVAIRCIRLLTHQRERVVFGDAGYPVARGYYTRNIVSILVALLVLNSFGLSMLSGVLPLYPGLPWQSHLGGLLGGVLAARLGSSRQSRT